MGITITIIKVIIATATATPRVPPIIGAVLMARKPIKTPAILGVRTFIINSLFPPAAKNRPHPTKADQLARPLTEVHYIPNAPIRDASFYN
jgi:hypothetical protein|nr:hypothetical protein [Koleobacter methoxysyntrophicus]